MTILGPIATDPSRCHWMLTPASADGPAGTAQVCGAPATVHLLFTEDIENGMACDLHALATVTLARHDINPACGMPGSLWDDDGCFHPFDDDRDLALTSAAPTTGDGGNR